MDVDEKQHPNSPPQTTTIQEIDFFDDHRRLIRTISGPENHHSLEEISFPQILGPLISTSNSAQETHLDQEAAVDQSRLSHAASSDDHDQKKRKTITTVRLFGNDIHTLPTVDDDDHDKKRSSKAKGKEKMIYNDEDSDQEPDHDDSHPIWTVRSPSHAKGIVINDQDKKPTPKKAKRSSKEETCKKKNPKKKKKEEDHNQQPSIPLPEPIHQLIQRRGGTDPVFMFRKTLKASDVTHTQNRLFINKSGAHKLLEALTEEERGKVVDKELRVSTMDPRVNEYELELTFWPAVGQNVLKHEWHKLVRANDLREGDGVECWGYRRQDGIFCLVLNVVRDRDPVALVRTVTSLVSMMVCCWVFYQNVFVLGLLRVLGYSNL